MRRIAFFVVLAVSSVSFADEGARLRQLAAANSAPDIVPQKDWPPQVIPSTPYQTAVAVAAPASPRTTVDDGLQHANFELRIANAKLVTEAGANKRALEQQNQNLISLANQVSALSGELRTKEIQLAAVRATGQAEERKNAELEQKLADGDSRMFNELLAVLVLLAAFVAALMVMVIMAAKNTAAVMKRIPDETSREYVDGVGAEYEAMCEAYEVTEARLREYAASEKVLADRLYEDVLTLKQRNSENVSAMLKILDEVGRDFGEMLKEDKRKDALLRFKLDEAIELAGFRCFEIAGQNRRMRAMIDEVEALRRKLADADETIAVMNGGKAAEPPINAPDAPASLPADLVAAPGAEPVRGTTAMAIVEDAEEARHLADRIIETRGGLLPEGEAVTQGRSKQKA